MKVYAIINHYGKIECYLSSKAKAAIYIEALFNEKNLPIVAHDSCDPYYRAKWYYEDRGYTRSFFFSKKNICNLCFVIQGYGYEVREIKVE